MELDVFDEIQRLRQLGQKAALATVVRIPSAGSSFRTSKLLIREDGSRLGSIGSDAIEADVYALKVPASFASQFYDLRNHVMLVRNRLKAAATG